jgi:hypothetical protein
MMHPEIGWQKMIVDCFDCEDCKFSASDLNSQKIAHAISQAQQSNAHFSDFEKELVFHIWKWAGAQEPAVDPILVSRLMRDATETAKARWNKEAGTDS